MGQFPGLRGANIPGQGPKLVLPVRRNASFRIDVSGLAELTRPAVARTEPIVPSGEFECRTAGEVVKGLGLGYDAERDLERAVRQWVGEPDLIAFRKSLYRSLQQFTRDYQVRNEIARRAQSLWKATRGSSFSRRPGFEGERQVIQKAQQLGLFGGTISRPPERKVEAPRTGLQKLADRAAENERLRNQPSPAERAVARLEAKKRADARFDAIRAKVGAPAPAANKPPPGFSPIPGSTRGGFHKRVGAKFVYWYPDTGVIEAPHAEEAAHIHQMHQVVSAALGGYHAEVVPAPKSVAGTPGSREGSFGAVLGPVMGGPRAGQEMRQPEPSPKEEAAPAPAPAPAPKLVVPAAPPPKSPTQLAEEEAARRGIAVGMWHDTGDGPAPIQQINARPSGPFALVLHEGQRGTYGHVEVPLDEVKLTDAPAPEVVVPGHGLMSAKEAEQHSTRLRAQQEEARRKLTEITERANANAAAVPPEEAARRNAEARRLAGIGKPTPPAAEPPKLVVTPGQSQATKTLGDLQGELKLGWPKLLAKLGLPAGLGITRYMTLAQARALAAPSKQEGEHGEATPGTSAAGGAGHRRVVDAPARGAGEAPQGDVGGGPQARPEGGTAGTLERIAELGGRPPATETTGEMGLDSRPVPDATPEDHKICTTIAREWLPPVEPLPENAYELPHPAAITNSKGEVVTHIDRLFPHQKEGAERILEAWKQRDGFILQDDAGLGKTLTALGALVAHGGKRNLIVVPVTNKEGLKTQWAGATAAGLYGIEFRAQNDVFEGKGKDKRLAIKGGLSATEPGYYIVSYDELTVPVIDPETGKQRKVAGPINKRTGKPGKAVPLREPNPALQGDWDTISFDESHTMVGHDGETGIAATAAKALGDKAKKVLYMSATPFTNITDMHYLTRLGNPNAEDLADRMFGNSAEEFSNWAEYVGATKKGNVVKNPPTWVPKVRIAAKLHVSGATVKRQASLTGMHSKFQQVGITSLSDEQRGVFDIADRIFTLGAQGLGEPIMGMWRTNWAKSYWETLKIPAAIELGKQALAEGKQVAIFSSYKAFDHAHLRKVPEKLFEIAEKLADAGKHGAAMQLTNAARDAQALVNQLPPATDITTRLVEAFGGGDSVAEIHGNTTKKPGDEQRQYQEGHKRVAVCTQAKGGTGISLHDTTGERPRVQINLSLPWSGRLFDQVAGRSHRLGSKSETTCHWVMGDAESERKMAGIVAQRLRNQNSYCSGDPAVKKDAGMLAAWEASTATVTSDDEKEDIQNLEDLTAALEQDDTEQVLGSEKLLDLRAAFAQYAQQLAEGRDLIGDAYRATQARKAHEVELAHARAAEQLRDGKKWHIITKERHGQPGYFISRDSVPFPEGHPHYVEGGWNNRSSSMQRATETKIAQTFGGHTGYHGLEPGQRSRHGYSTVRGVWVPQSQMVALAEDQGVSKRKVDLRSVMARAKKEEAAAAEAAAKEKANKAAALEAALSEMQPEARSAVKALHDKTDGRLTAVKFGSYGGKNYFHLVEKRPADGSDTLLWQNRSALGVVGAQFRDAPLHGGKGYTVPEANLAMVADRLLGHADWRKSLVVPAMDMDRLLERIRGRMQMQRAQGPELIWCAEEVGDAMRREPRLPPGWPAELLGGLSKGPRFPGETEHDAMVANFGLDIEEEYALLEKAELDRAASAPAILVHDQSDAARAILGQGQGGQARGLLAVAGHADHDGGLRERVRGCAIPGRPVPAGAGTSGRMDVDLRADSRGGAGAPSLRHAEVLQPQALVLGHQHRQHAGQVGQGPFRQDAGGEQPGRQAGLAKGSADPTAAREWRQGEGHHGALQHLEADGAGYRASTELDRDDWLKSRSHKYVKRTPTGNPKRPWRYWYKLPNGQVVSSDDLQTGARFKVTHLGQEGHFEVLNHDKERDLVHVRHDESKREAHIRTGDLQRMVQGYHAKKTAAANAAAGIKPAAVLPRAQMGELGKGGYDEIHGFHADVEKLHQQAELMNKPDREFAVIKQPGGYVLASKAKGSGQVQPGTPEGDAAQKQVEQHAARAAQIESKIQVYRRDPVTGEETLVSPKAETKQPAAETKPAKAETKQPAEAPTPEDRQTKLLMRAGSDEAGGKRIKAIPASYEVVEAGDLIASHNPLTFDQRAEYPAGVQERGYHEVKSDRDKIDEIARNIEPMMMVNTNPDGINGAPVVTEEGIVLGGNGRTMGMQRAYAQYPEQAQQLRDYLTKHARAFGYSSADVAKMKNPVLIRRIKAGNDPKALGALGRRLNESMTQGLDPRHAEVTLGKHYVNREVMDSLMHHMDPDERLSDFLNSSKSAPFVQRLEQSGIIDQFNKGEFVDQDTGLLNEDGRLRVERVLAARVIPDAGLLSRMNQRARESIAKAVPYLAQMEARGWDVRKSLELAVRADIEQRKDGLFDAKDPKAARERYLAEAESAGMGSSGIRTRVNADGVARALFDVMQDHMGGRKFPMAMKAVALEADRQHHDHGDQGAMFQREKVSPEEAIRHAFKLPGPKKTTAPEEEKPAEAAKPKKLRRKKGESETDYAKRVLAAAGEQKTADGEQVAVGSEQGTPAASEESGSGDAERDSVLEAAHTAIARHTELGNHAAVEHIKNMVRMAEGSTRPKATIRRLQQVLDHHASTIPGAPAEAPGWGSGRREQGPESPAAETREEREAREAREAEEFRREYDRARGRNVEDAPPPPPPEDTQTMSMWAMPDPTWFKAEDVGSGLGRYVMHAITWEAKNLVRAAVGACKTPQDGIDGQRVLKRLRRFVEEQTREDPTFARGIGAHPVNDATLRGLVQACAQAHVSHLAKSLAAYSLWRDGKASLPQSCGDFV